jgi:hypothetical protein
MKRVISLGLLTCFVAGSVAQIVASPEQVRSQPIIATSPTASSAPVQQRDVFYFSDRFGFRLVSPSGYILTPGTIKPAPRPPVPLEVLELWQQVDFPNRDSLPETPPIISITVHSNSRRLPLNQWKGELSRKDDRPMRVAGQPAIAYTSTGLYEYDNVLVGSPDGRYVFRLTVGYMDAKAPIRKVFQELVSSFTFDLIPDPKAPSKWRINYNRLQTLLAAKHWQAADVETRAVLQRLAGSKADLLFSSKSVVSRIPLRDLQTLDSLWSKASGGRFGFTAQQRLWQQAARGSGNSRARVERFAQLVGWRRNQPLLENNPIGMALSGGWWRLDSELNYAASAPVGHLPWVGVSSSRLIDLLSESGPGCGSCTIDAMYLANDRYHDYLPAFFTRFKP